ncbi:MAG: transposase [Clostridia bacterium]|nr:transposase [Clostridia bacterium]
MEIRKHPRLKDSDYAAGGAYFVTVCTHVKAKTLGSVVGRGLAPAVPRLTDCGRIVEQQLLDLENRFKHIKVDKYVIMPNHVHVIFIVMPAAAGASPRPTVSDVICAWKSLSARRCKTEGKCQKLWQSSFYDHIIRDENDYLTRWNYIDTNPARWAEDEYYS